ncbi:tyrosine-type recombinase/integrase [Paenibacillus albidus]|uniref:tyrosine-type recombinase/integrase n=1 Tax=Paenibacillus albidus TaxID=2041023 RepID=UPI001E58F152|nr:tyrosine-type recombinase/integrase [Paenibacillus albidus]
MFGETSRSFEAKQPRASNSFRPWALKRLADRGEIEANVYPHRFRHTFTCQLLDNGAPLDFIQGMLGHKKASTTQIYAQLRC